MPLQSIAHTVMELTLALVTAANAAYDNPNGLSVTLTGPSTVMAGQVVELGIRIDAEDKTGLNALGASVRLPQGWGYEGLGAAVSGPLPPVHRLEDATQSVSFAWITGLDQFPFHFHFRVKAADPLEGAVLTARAEYRTTGPPHKSDEVSIDLLAPDTTPPVIVLKGGEIVVLEVGNPYEDPGWIATDDVDGDISDRVVVGGRVDPSVLGDYTLTYNVSDTAGNAAIQKTRLVQVVPEDITAKGFFLCGTGPTATPARGDVAALLLVSLGVFLIAGRRRNPAAAPIRTQGIHERKR